MRVAVIGGGAAGLAACMRLGEGGAQVVLYESQARVGGLLATRELGGVRMDTAVQLVSSTYTRLFALARDAGAGDVLVRSSGQDALWRKGRANEITYGSVPSMITSGALPTMLKMKLGAKYVPFLTLQTGTLDANDPASTGGLQWDSESIATWGAREIGDDFVEYLTYPLLAAYYGSPPEHTTAAMYHALARVGMEVQVYAARDGMAHLADAVAGSLRARGVDIRVNAGVTALARAAGEWRVQSAAGAESFDAVLIAADPSAAAAILQGSGAELAEVSEWVRGVRTTPAATLSLVIDGSVRAGWFGVSFPRNEAPGDEIVAIAVQQNKPAGLVPAGSTALTVFPRPEIVARMAGMNGQAAAQMLGGAAERVFPGATRRLRAAGVNMLPSGYRSLAPGMVTRINALRALRMPAGFALAGDYTMAPTVEGAVRSGERAAAALLAQRGAQV